MKIYQKNITKTNTLSVCLPHPPNAPYLEPSPSGSSVDKFRYRQRLPGSKNFVYQSCSEQIRDYEYDTHTLTAPPLTYRTSNRPPPDCLSDKRSGTVRVPG